MYELAQSAIIYVIEAPISRCIWLNSAAAELVSERKSDRRVVFKGRSKAEAAMRELAWDAAARSARTPASTSSTGRCSVAPRCRRLRGATASSLAHCTPIGPKSRPGTLRLGRVGDLEQLRHELGRLQRIARQSGSVSY